MKHRRGLFSEDIGMAHDQADSKLMLYRVRARRTCDHRRSRPGHARRRRRAERSDRGARGDRCGDQPASMSRQWIRSGTIHWHRDPLAFG